MTLSEALADRVHQLERRNAQLRRDLYTQRNRAELWRTRALKRNTTAARSESLDGTHAPGGR